MDMPGDQNSSAPAAEGSRDAHASSGHKEDTNMWTTVKKYLHDPQNAPEPRVSCPICMVEIAIRGVPGQQPNPHKLADEQQKVGVVLVCSHIVCQECIRKHIISQAESTGIDGLRSCPCCRSDLRFECGHLVPSKRIPLASGEGASMVPLTKMELAAAGDTFPSSCFLCVEQRCQDHANHSLDSIAALTHGATQVNDMMAWERVSEGFLEALKDYVAKITSGPTWLHVDPSDLLLDVAFINDERLGDSAKKSPDDGVDLIEEIQLDGLAVAVWSVPCWREQR